MFEQDQLIRKIVTTNEVVDILGVSKQTIYNYVKLGKLKLVYDDWQIDGTMKFFIEEVNKLKQFTEKTEGLTVLEAANQFGVSKATIHQYIKSGKIDSKKINFKGRMTVFIPTEEVEKLNRSFQNTTTKKSYFTKDLEYLLFGLYIKADSNEKARIIELSETGELVAKTNMGELLSKAELVERGFVKAYELKQTKHSTKRGNIIFQFPIPQSISAPIFGIIDAFYQHIGVQNMNLFIQKHSINVEIKPVKIPYRSEQIEQDFEILDNCLIDGKLSNRPGFIVFTSKQEQLTTFVEDIVKTEIKKIATEYHTGIEDITEKLIKIGLAEFKKNKELNL